MPITTRAQYDEMIAEREAAVVAIRQQGRDEFWTSQQRLEAEAVVLLPFRKILSDPDNPGISAFAREDLQKKVGERGIPFVIAQPDDYADLQAILAQQTKEFNRMHGTNYLPPVLGVGIGREKDTGSPASYHPDYDMIVLDADIIQTLRKNPDIAQALIGHELNHRYQRSDADMLALLKMQVAERLLVTLDPQTMVELRRIEAESDFAGAQMSSPEAMIKTLLLVVDRTDAVQDQWMMEQMAQKENPSVDDMKAIKDAFPKLTPEQRAEALTRGFQEELKLEPALNHPSTISRIELQTALKNNPELLKRSLQFNEANIVGVEDKGPAYTPEQLAAINRQADAQVGMRGSPK